MNVYVSDVVDTWVSKISLLTRIIVSVLFQNISSSTKVILKYGVSSAMLDHLVFISID
jgi:hypothetical protein